MSRRPIIAVLALLLLGALAAVPIAAATDQTTTPLSLGVAPSKLQLRLKPGHTVRANLKIYNKGSKPVTIDVFPQDYTVDMDSNVKFLPAGTLRGSAAPWTTLSETLLKVPAGGYRNVVATIRVPQSIPPGTHTLAVLFRSHTITSAAGLRYQSAVASLMAAGVTDANGGGLVLKAGVIAKSTSVQWKSLLSVRSPSGLIHALFKPTMTTNIAVVNSGNTFFNILHGAVTYKKGLSLGGSDTTIKAPHYTILPGSTRLITTAWTSAPFLGWSTVQTGFYYNPTTALSLTSPDRVLIIPWNLLFVVTVVTALVVVWRLMRARRRRRAQAPGRKVVWADSK